MEVTNADRYNPELLPQLEQNIEKQVMTQTYNLDTNLCLLRLYQFYPERVNTRILTQLLLKAVMALPNQDYELCRKMIPERLQLEEPIASLNNLVAQMNNARFKEFWQAYATMKESLDAVPGLKDACRRYAVHVLCSTYQTLPKTVIGETLALSGAALDAFIATQRAEAGWVLEDQNVVLPANEDNHPVAKKAAESIPFKTVSQCLMVVS